MKSDGTGTAVYRTFSRKDFIFKGHRRICTYWVDNCHLSLRAKLIQMCGLIFTLIEVLSVHDLENLKYLIG